MESATGKIIALSGRNATVVVETSVRCQRCLAGNGCGAGIFQATGKKSKIQVAITLDGQFSVGDEIRLTIGGQTLLRAATLAYGLPLMMMLAMLIAGTALSGTIGDLAGAVLAGLGLAAGFIIGQTILRRQSVCQQFVLSVGRSFDGNSR